jgi:hypothetical protein
VIYYHAFILTDNAELVKVCRIDTCVRKKHVIIAHLRFWILSRLLSVIYDNSDIKRPFIPSFCVIIAHVIIATVPYPIYCQSISSCADRPATVAPSLHLFFLLVL